MIALIGMPGSGKSAVGRALARKLGTQFIDTDAAIERETGLPVTEIFSRYGEAFFRAKETEVLRALLAGDGVLSCGGGLPIFPQNAALLRENATVVYLAASLDTLCARCRDGATRPLLAGDVRGKLTELLRARQGAYEACGHIRIDTDTLTPSQIADRIIAALP